MHKIFGRLKNTPFFCKSARSRHIVRVTTDKTTDICFAEIKESFCINSRIFFCLSVSCTTDKLTTSLTGDIRLLRSQIVTSKMQVLYSHTVLWSHLASGSASIILYCICSCVYSCIYSCKSHLITKCDRSHAVTVSCTEIG